MKNYKFLSTNFILPETHQMILGRNTNMSYWDIKKASNNYNKRQWNKIQHQTITFANPNIETIYYTQKLKRCLNETS